MTKRMLTVDEATASQKSRLVALRIAGLTLRMMENLRQPFKDYESGMILIAIAAILGEKLTRTSLEPELQDLARPIPTALLTTCNINSIAAATGINRETARRKVNKLIAAGLLERAERRARVTRGRTRTSASTDTARPSRAGRRRASSLRSRGGRPL